MLGGTGGSQAQGGVQDGSVQGQDLQDLLILVGALNSGYSVVL